jgi:hypothetical protein
MDYGFAQIVFRTPDCSIHNPRLTTKGDDLNDISSRAFHGLNIKSSGKPSRQSAADVNGYLAIMTVDCRTHGFPTEETELIPSSGKD